MDSPCLKCDEPVDVSNDHSIEWKQQFDQLKNVGNSHFKDKKYDLAIEAYTSAIEICPLSHAVERSIAFNNRAAAYFYKHKEVEKPEDYHTSESDEINEETPKPELYLDKCVADCSSAIELNENYFKPYLMRGKAYRIMGAEKLDLSLADNEMVVKLDPSVWESHQAIKELKIEIDERNEKMKNEMIGKLKDIGNVVLNKFGLSTDNFQMVKNPATGSYSINFKS